MADDATNLKAVICELAAVPPHQLRSTAIEWLLGAGRQRRAAAAELMTRAGAAVVPTLLDEAFRPRLKAAQRVAVLDVIDRIGAPPDVSQWFTLAYACSSPYRKSVREIVRRVLARIGQPDRR